MQTLVYKMTHQGDPDPTDGVWGKRNCMRRVRSYDYSQVIGVGGLTASPALKGRIIWIGIGATREDDRPEPLVRFTHFLFFGDSGPLLKDNAPALAAHLLDRGARLLLDPASLSAAELREIECVLTMANNTPALPALSQHSSQPAKPHCPTKRVSKATTP